MASLSPQQRAVFLALVPVVVLGLILSLLSEPAIAQSPAKVGRDFTISLVEIEGTVEYFPAGATSWKRAALNQSVNVGDMLRTGDSSRLALRLGDQSVVRKGSRTTVEIKPPPVGSDKPVLDLKAGILYYLGRDKTDAIQIRTPPAAGTIRGTEFNLAVATDGSTLLSVIDGEVDLANEHGTVRLTNGMESEARPGQAPRAPVPLQSTRADRIQWALYYPAVLDPDELALSDSDKRALGESLSAYRRGNITEALARYPKDRVPDGPAERVYFAALLLSVGDVERAQPALREISNLKSEISNSSELADALGKVIASVKFQFDRGGNQTSTPAQTANWKATAWLAESYALQSIGDLRAARSAAARAVEVSPRFGFAWARLAELEFGFGFIPKTEQALARALSLSPENAAALALRGFLLCAQNRWSEARAAFESAIAADGSMGQAWLGRGLVRIRRGDLHGGRQDLQMAVLLEPQRALFRSYLGKAFAEEKDWDRGEKELELARRFDPNDPTARLYSALLNSQLNKLNEGIRDLERSKELSNNRSVFRSELLLDQDQAVRGANLAALYRDAGLTDVSVREASRAVNFDYANASAHLFLAGSYDALRDARQVNLRYETPWFGELLLANLLAPVGSISLSQAVSQQEYSKLFGRDHVGLSSGTQYLSNGDWRQYGSQFGTFGNVGYALDSFYQSQRGFRPNEDLEQLTFYGTIKAQLSPRDSLFLQFVYYNNESGDVRQVYDSANTNFFSATLRFEEKQDPNVFAGYHHEWSPGSHSLLLVSRLQDRVSLVDPDARFLVLARQPDGTIRRSLVVDRFNQTYQSELVAGSVELQQIWETGKQTLIAGARFQAGEAETRSEVFRSSTTIPANLVDPNGLLQANTTTLERQSLYAYEHWQPLDWIRLIGGLSYDRLVFPNNIDLPPLANGVRSVEQFSPKAGFILTLTTNTYLRGAYTRSLGGVYYDSSVRLEPVQVAGFVQAFRSAIPESVVGPVAGSEFETWGLGLDHKFRTGTYFGVDAEVLRSSAARESGVFDFRSPPALATVVSETLEFEERTLHFTFNQLLGEAFSFGISYRLSDADLTTRMPAILAAATGPVPGGSRDEAGVLHQLSLTTSLNCAGGFFALAEALWTLQRNRGQVSALPGDNFWQLNLMAGYRFRNRAAELGAGFLNLLDQDYRLNPLNLHSELPRERTFVARFKFNF